MASAYFGWPDQPADSARSEPDVFQGTCAVGRPRPRCSVITGVIRPQVRDDRPVHAKQQDRLRTGSTAGRSVGLSLVFLLLLPLSGCGGGSPMSLVTVVVNNRASAVRPVSGAILMRLAGVDSSSCRFFTSVSTFGGGDVAYQLRVSKSRSARIAQEARKQPRVVSVSITSAANFAESPPNFTGIHPSRCT